MNVSEDYRSHFSLVGKVALVAGGAGGIGSAVSQGLASFGAEVIVADYAEKAASEVAERISREGGKAEAIYLNALDVAHIEASVDAAVTKFGSIDILANCVGSHIEAPAEEYTEKDWDTVMNINLKSSFFLSQAVAKHQIASEMGGRHIHVTSLRSLLGIHRGYSAYCASKGGMNMMVKQLAVEWAKYGIKVNAIAPTFTRTSLVKEYLEDPNFYNTLVDRIPLGRVCEPMDIANAMIYLSMAASDYISGHVLVIDGGLSASQ
jgi:NAD(P)-dependent dehydrogenase (short-subunit alcohol dehydrogenase family)